MKFDSTFWISKLEELGYKVRPETLELGVLREQRVIPRDVEPLAVRRLVDEEYVEVALIELSREEKQLTRSRCARIARRWKDNRMVRPLLLFTDGVDSYAIIVPGKGLGGEAKILGLSGELYRTDLEVLESMRHPGNAEELKQCYDSVFFPYEKVRDEFFEGYRNLYQKLEKAVREVIPEDSSGYAQRFLGRLMFLYFLQRKGWLQRNRRFIDSIKDYREFNEVIYEGLCQGRIDGIPFLNGSLFEKEPYLNQAMEERLYQRVNPIFIEARSFFNQYNFTVDESSPLDIDVSIDPALIGTVFENMLPEQERGAKGTFYTPRNEVSFICRRALVNWLGRKDVVLPTVGEDEVFIDGLDTLVEELRKKRDEDRVRELKRRVLSAKILDPAVGSGGFLLGVMQEIIEFVHRIEETVGWRTDPEELKTRILPNLYGFDIEPEAIEIARLRLWLSLIIDQKTPTPLPNLDLNLVDVQDSLLRRGKPKPATFEDLEKAKRLLERFKELSDKYLYARDPVRKKELKIERLGVVEELDALMGLDPNTIEASMHDYADIIVMNPPYVRQEEIPRERKEYYVKTYDLDKKSDLYAYFMVRVFDLLAKGGVASIISSDKWLETGYGVKLQKRLRGHVIAVYGQRERSFGADINTVITVYSKQSRRDPVDFTYLEKYGGEKVIRSVSLQRRRLSTGKWFYLRAPKFFVEKILPRLTHKLGDFAEIKRGFTTGANDFFYMKDISHLYEADYLANPQKFEEWGVTAKTRRELEEQGLIYIENEGGERFVLNREDVSKILRSPKEIQKYLITEVYTYVFKINKNNTPKDYSKKYVEWGEKKEIIVKRGKNKGKKIFGYNKLNSTKMHRPKWYHLAELPPSRIILIKFTHERHFTPYSKQPIYADHTCDMVYSKKIKDIILWAYMNSTLFNLTKEIYGLRMGGAALQLLTNIVLNLPILNLEHLKFSNIYIKILNRAPLDLYNELLQEDRRELDRAVLKALGFEDSEAILEELYRCFVEVVEDRLIKADRPLKRLEGKNDD